MMNQNLPNGVPLQFNAMNRVPSQDKSVNPYNGLGSVHSSRDSSPVTRFQQIPSSQLPPLKTGIPPTQLPPSRGHNANFNHLTQNYGPRSISSASTNEATPFSSPKVQTFNTSTPTDSGVPQDKLKPSVSNFNPSVLSPISTAALLENKQSAPLLQSFTHSATSQFTNVVRNIPEGKSDGRNPSKISESTVVKNTPVVMPSEMVDVCLDKTKPDEMPHDVQFSALSIDGAKLNKTENLQKPFDMNVFTNQTSLQQNLMGQIPKPVTSPQNSPSRQPLQQQTHKPTTVLQNIPQVNPPGSYQEHKPPNASQLFPSNLKNQQISQPPIINQYPKAGPTTNNMPMNIPASKPPENISSSSNVNIQPRTQIQHLSNTGTQQFHNNPQFRQSSPLMNNGPKTPNVIPFTQASNLPGGQAKQNILPPSTQPTLNTTNQAVTPTSNPSNRPKFQSTLSQPRLNSYHIASNNYSQSVQQTPNNPSNQYIQASHSFGSTPNLTLQQMPPRSDNLSGPPQSSQETYASPNIATSTNIQNPLTNVTQTASPHNQNQMRPHMHSNRYPMQQPPVNYPNIQQQQQQPYQAASTYPNPQQALYQTKPESQNFSPNVYQTQVPQNPAPQIQQAPQNQYQNYNKNQSVTQAGFSKMWGTENYDLLQSPNILPPTKVEAPNISLGHDFLDSVNCNPDIFRCTMTKIPETSNLLQKSRLPLGVLIHPFRDLNHLPVIQCNTIVRCRACRTYINPFVFFVDAKRWKCNLCYRINELPEEFQYDPVSKTYGDPSRRPEVKASTIEYIAPAEYMLRPPQPAVYLYLFDVSRLAVESGYLHTVCNVLSSELVNLPGDARTHVGFLAYDSALHFYSLSEGQNQPHEMTIIDIDDVFLPCPDNLLVNLQDRMELVSDLLSQLPTRYNSNYDTGSALGAALQIAYKMMAGTGGRVTVFQAVLPNCGPGSLSAREDPSQRAAAEISHLNPANDFYKRLALECSGQQIAVDLFILNSQYVDLATISGISRFSGGCMHHFPLFKASRTLQNESLERCFRRYVTRKIGFEAVMRIRCTRGLSIHTFHGNFFVRSTDLLSLPNINPDAGFGMQVSIEENLSDVQTVCFQAALLYTSSKGERRIRVHTICLPVASSLTDIINAADQQCIIGLLSKMAVDRSMQSSLSDAREAFLNVAIDILSSYKISLNVASGQSGLMAPQCLKLLPLYISALLKSHAFRIGTSTRLDDRVKAMCDMKTRPLPYLIQQIYPDLYPVHNLEEQTTVLNEEEEQVHIPPHIQLTARNIDSNGAYLLDMGEHMVLFVCSAISPTFLDQVLGVANFNSINDEMYEIPTLDNPRNQMLLMFISYLNDEKPFPATIQVMKENSPNRGLFLERLIEDRMENSLSYHEFLQHVKTQVK